MKCQECNSEIPQGLSNCASCGAPVPKVVFVQQQVTYQEPPKQRVVYILLAIFLGYLGIHNFYAGYTSKGIIQLLLSVLLFWTIIVPIAVFVWYIIEIITVTKDSNGRLMV